MWAPRYYSTAYWTPRYWPPGGVAPHGPLRVTAVIGAVIVVRATLTAVDVALTDHRPVVPVVVTQAPSAVAAGATRASGLLIATSRSRTLVRVLSSHSVETSSGTLVKTIATSSVEQA